MDYDLSEEATVRLSRMYDSCRAGLKVKSGSIIGDIISKTNNSRADLLRKNAVKKNDIPDVVRTELLRKKLIAETGQGSYAITFWGIWYVENFESISSEEDLLNWIQTKYFDPLFSETGESINDRDKCVAFSLIAMRAFSQGSCMNLKNDSGARDIWWEILKKSSKILSEAKIVKKVISDEDFMDKTSKSIKGSDDPIVNVVRHSFNLKGPSNGRYASNKLEYWFNINNEDDKPDYEVLGQIIFAIFGKIDEEKARALSDSCNELCLDYSWKIEQYCEDTSFFDVEYDSFIRKSFEVATWDQ